MTGKSKHVPFQSSEPVTGNPGGVMTGLKILLNGPVSCLPNQ
ncbi:hypothetical protein ALO_00795 [Acetonema longum DSM 6540]|uniref:Uncharacterized protein n=1 Tax=Acetonema longum DSM 6540 TaxID=1009370 RepID=F7NDQ2_9FIRM|nr:hypothetical protein ALO_00795 [Acetonema longum DSM 6540]